MNNFKCKVFYLTKYATCIVTHFGTTLLQIIVLTSEEGVLLAEDIDFVSVHVFCLMWGQCTVCEVV